MPRNGSGVYSFPAGGDAVSGATIDSSKYNTRFDDVEADLNTDRPLEAGGTGASLSAPGADRLMFYDQSALTVTWATLGSGLAFNGTVVELDADLSTLAGLTVAADNFIAGNSGGTAWEVKTPADARTSLGLGSMATETATDYAAVANNLSDLNDAATARTNLGLDTMALEASADYSTTAAANAAYVAKSGDTMTGDLTVSKSLPELTLDDTDATNDTGSLRQLSGFLRLRSREGSSNGGIIFEGFNGTAVTTFLRFSSTGQVNSVLGIYNRTSAQASNVYINSDGNIFRSTSAAKYKKDIEPIDLNIAYEYLEVADKNAIWYRANTDLCVEDDPAWGFYGFRADGFAEAMPQLVHFGEKEDGSLEVEGFAYERTTALHARLLADMDRRLRALEQGVPKPDGEGGDASSAAAIPVEIADIYEAHGGDPQAVFERYVELGHLIQMGLASADDHAMHQRLTPHVPWLKQRGAVEVV